MVSGKSPDIKYQQWMDRTKLGWNNPRSKEIKKVDAAIKAYDEGITAFYKNASPYVISSMQKGNYDVLLYKEKLYLTEIQVALAAWKKTYGNHNQWANSSRNNNYAISQLDLLIFRQMPKYGRSMLKPPDEAFAANARTGILHFLSNSKTRGMTSDPASLLTDTAFFAADVQHLVTVRKTHTASDLATGMTSNSTSSTSFANSANSVGWLNELYTAIVDWLKEQFTGDNLLGEMASEVTNLISHVPKILGVVFSSLLSELGNVIGIGKNIKSAISAYSTYRHKQELEDGILSGHPKQIIQSVHEQIRASMVDSGKDILFSGLKIGLNIASAGAGVVLSAVANVIVFFRKIYTRITAVRFKNIAAIVEH
jgi:hypothetical protein